MNFSVFCLLLFLWGSASETSGLVILYLSLLCFFTHLLKFYSGGAVDLWSCFGRHGLNIAPVIQHSVGLSQDFSQILKHLKQVEANIQ